MTPMPPIQILFAAEGGLADAPRIDPRVPDLPIKVEVADRLESALRSLAESDFDCVVFALNGTALPPVATVRASLDINPQVPVVMLVDGLTLSDALSALEAGAADCLPLGSCDGETLAAAIWKAARVGRAAAQLEQAEARAEFYSMHDRLTGLPNRALFFDRLDQAMEVARRSQGAAALLNLDINGFTTINRNLGHSAGDAFLRQVAERLRATLRRSDVLCRLGDDEFAIMMPTGASLAGAVTAAGKILNCMEQPFEIEHQTISIGTSVGIAVHPAHGRSSEDLLRHAQAAMRSAKQNGSTFQVYAAGEEDENTEALSLANDLRSAVDRDELQVYFQPKVDLRRRRVCGMESLLRWRHTERGMIYPDVFIPLAEQTGLIELLTRWVMNAALEHGDLWRRRGFAMPISVNLSAKTLHNLEFPDTVKTLLEKWQIPASNLILEITESAIIADVTRATETVTRLHAMGVTISIDDFGTGYTSFSYIRRLPVTEIKIDKSYVLNMVKAADDRVIVGTLIELGHNLGLQVVAEGIEDAETLELLGKLGCDIGQGYYVSPPRDARAIDAWLAESEWGIGREYADCVRRVAAVSAVR